jgi:hypothetical protein
MGPQKADCVDVGMGQNPPDGTQKFFPPGPPVSPGAHLEIGTGVGLECSGKDGRPFAAASVKSMLE